MTIWQSGSAGAGVGGPTGGDPRTEAGDLCRFGSDWFAFKGMVPPAQAVYKLTECSAGTILYTTKLLTSGIDGEVGNIVTISEYSGCWTVSLVSGDVGGSPEALTLVDSYGTCLACTDATGPVPTSCVPATWTGTSYQITGWPASVVACSSGDIITNTLWDGSFDYFNSCNWLASNVGGNPPAILDSGANKRRIANGGTSDDDTALRLDPGVKWRLSIAHRLNVSPGDIEQVWVGNKTVGNTPAGTYTFESSECGNSGNLEVVSA